jgi:hypothetical protein
MSLGKLEREILLHGIDDWVQMCEVASVARGVLPRASAEEIREKSVRAVGELREHGCVRVGDLTKAGFSSWVGDTAEIVGRIDAEWRALGSPNLGDIGWLENTPIGNRIGLEEWKARSGESRRRGSD